MRSSRTASRSWSSKAVVAARMAFDAVSVMVTSEARTIPQVAAKLEASLPRVGSSLISEGAELGPAVQHLLAPRRDLGRSESEGASRTRRWRTRSVTDQLTCRVPNIHGARSP